MKTCNSTLNFAFSCFRRDKGYLRVSEIFVRISRLLAVLLSRRSMFASLLFYGRLLLFLFTVCQLRVASFHMVGRPTICLTWISGYYGFVIMHATCLFTNRKKKRRIPLSTLSDLCAVWVLQLGKNMIETKCTVLSSWLIALSTLTLGQGSSLRVLAVGFSTRHPIALNR